jgi:hypothetical protein
VIHAELATDPGSSTSANEDWAGVAASAVAVVLDGLSAPGDIGTGCAHGTPWYVEQLGPRLLALAGDPATSPADALAHAIDQVAQLHPGCDLTHPGTPSATVTLLRALGDQVEYLVLADAVLLLDTRHGLCMVTDNRVNRLATRERTAAFQHPTGSAAHQRWRLRMISVLRRARNQPGGYWVAAADPLAAKHAITDVLPRREVRCAALLSDGASRLVDQFRLATWDEMLVMLDNDGPAELIRRVRAAEATDPDGRRWPRSKRHDDATAVYVSFEKDKSKPHAMHEAVQESRRSAP